MSVRNRACRLCLSLREFDCQCLRSIASMRWSDRKGTVRVEDWFFGIRWDNGLSHHNKLKRLRLLGYVLRMRTTRTIFSVPSREWMKPRGDSTTWDGRCTTQLFKVCHAPLEKTHQPNGRMLRRILQWTTNMGDCVVISYIIKVAEKYAFVRLDYIPCANQLLTLPSLYVHSSPLLHIRYLY